MGKLKDELLEAFGCKKAKKMNSVKLKALKKQRDEARAKFNKIDENLRENCHCPPQFMKTEVGYETDTLGSNGRNYYQDFCSVCGKYHGTYGGVYSSHRSGAKYPTAEKKDFQ